MMFSYIPNGSITSVQGIKAAGIHCGLKRKRKDLALILSDYPCTVAGTFTLNKVQAAPLQISKEIIKAGGKVRAVLINSGNANACTGEQGINDAKLSQEYLAGKLKLSPEEVIVSSTGVIGEYLPMNVLLSGIDSILPKLSYSGGYDAAKAIMTTDLVPKSLAVKLELSGGEIIIGGIAKGSGMIMPDMATMLAFIATDALVDSKLLQKIISKTVNNSFNKISVDGDTSTNDMVVILANGATNVKIEEGTEDEIKFTEALQALAIDFAKAIVKDGEGATKLITLNVIGGKTQEDVDKIAKAIVNSPLVKTAIYGNDANWGRIIAAAGRSGADFNPGKVEIKFNDLVILKSNYVHNFDERKASEVLSNPEITITVDLKDGNAKTTWWTCDFSEEYIRINALYRT